MRAADTSEAVNGRLPSDAPVVSVVMSTYNRADLLPGAIDGVLAQDAGTPPFELLVVDNNSTDGTRGVIEAAARRDRRVRYVFEPRQGLSHARNAGIAAARAALITFTDDDVRAERGWVAAIARACADHPDASMVGGRVLPDWPAPPPAWLTPSHWAPLALLDYGDAPVRVDASRPICLVGANLTIRREVFDAIGPFDAELQRVRDGIGSLEDHGFLLRAFEAGLHGVYDPRIVIHAAVQPNRLTREYHRRWHRGHGHFYALLRAPHVERSRAGTLFGVPLHLYRQAVADACGWAAAAVGRRPDDAFRRELALRFFAGFSASRRRQFRADPHASVMGELRALAGARMPAPPRAAAEPPAHEPGTVRAPQ
jgi:glycosyltransferase involved in cell wall biosynthesis